MSKLVQFLCIYERALNKNTIYLTVMKMSLLTLGDWRRVVRTEVDQMLVYWKNQPTKLETKISTCLRIDRQTEISHFVHFLNRFGYFLYLTYRYVCFFLLFSMGRFTLRISTNVYKFPKTVRISTNFYKSPKIVFNFIIPRYHFQHQMLQWELVNPDNSCLFVYLLF